MWAVRPVLAFFCLPTEPANQAAQPSPAHHHGSQHYVRTAPHLAASSWLLPPKMHTRPSLPLPSPCPQAGRIIILLPTAWVPPLPHPFGTARNHDTKLLLPSQALTAWACQVVVDWQIPSRSRLPPTESRVPEGTTRIADLWTVFFYMHGDEEENRTCPLPREKETPASIVLGPPFPPGHTYLYTVADRQIVSQQVSQFNQSGTHSDRRTPACLPLEV